MSYGKVLIMMGSLLLAVGAFWMLGERLGLGRLPGDIAIRGERFTFYFPLATCLLISVLLNLLLWIVQRVGQ
jgi:hypothetical protein